MAAGLKLPCYPERHSLLSLISFPVNFTDRMTTKACITDVSGRRIVYILHGSQIFPVFFPVIYRDRLSRDCVRHQPLPAMRFFLAWVGLGAILPPGAAVSAINERRVSSDRSSRRRFGPIVSASPDVFPDARSSVEGRPVSTPRRGATSSPCAQRASPSRSWIVERDKSPDASACRR
jgi:hypothetical protein